MKRAILCALGVLLAHGVFLAEKVHAHLATGIVVDSQGRIYFTDPLRNLIWRMDTAGKLSLLVRDKHVGMLALDGNDNLYFATESIWKLTPEGNLLEIVRKNQIAPELGWPITVDRQGNIYFCNGPRQRMSKSQIWRRTPEGEVTLLAGSDWGHKDGKGIQAEFTHIDGHAWGPDGSLFVKNANALRKVAPDGTVTTVIEALVHGVRAGVDDGFGRPIGLAVDSQGNVYVVDSGNRSIRKLAANGKNSVLVKPAWPWAPTGIAVSGGDVYALEFFLGGYAGLPVPPLMGRLVRSPRVRRISSDGVVVTMFGKKSQR